MTDAVWIGIGTALGIAFVTAARRGSARHTRLLYAQALVIAAVIYVFFAALGGAGGRWWSIEVAGVAGFGLLAWLGVRRSGYFLAAGWLLHVLWDLLLHGPESYFVPAWYPAACLGFDVIVAIYAVIDTRQRGH